MSELSWILDFDAYPFGSSTLEVWICAHVSSESHVRNDVRCEKEVESVGVRVKGGIQRLAKCAVHDICK